MEAIMNNTEFICKKCGSNELHFSLSERMNTIFEIKNGIIKKIDTAYPDDGEINYVVCSKCGANIEFFDENEIILSTLNL